MASIKVMPSASNGQGNPIWFKITQEGFNDGTISYTLTISYPNGEHITDTINSNKSYIYKEHTIQYNIPNNLTNNGIVDIGYKVVASNGADVAETDINIITIYKNQVIQLRDNHGTVIHPETESRAVYRNGTQIEEQIPYRFNHSFNANVHTLTAFNRKPNSDYIMGSFKATAPGGKDHEYRIIFKLDNNIGTIDDYNELHVITALTSNPLPDELFQLDAIISIGLDITNKKIYILSGAGGNSGGGGGAVVRNLEVIALSINWTLNGSTNRYENTISVPPGKIYDNDFIYASPINGSINWGYDIRIDDITSSQIKLSAASNPGVDISYKFTITTPNELHVDALDIHNIDPNAHANIELTIN